MEMKADDFFLYIDTNAKWSHSRPVYFMDMQSFASCGELRGILFDMNMTHGHLFYIN